MLEKARLAAQFQQEKDMQELSAGVGGLGAEETELDALADMDFGGRDRLKRLRC